MSYPDRLRQIAEAHPYPLLFATISGAHLYGFASPDSDWDLRGCHVLPAREVLGLRKSRETIDVAEDTDGLELDLVTHDAGKYFSMMLKPNGYVLEQIHSPLVVLGGERLERLRELARGCVTRHHVHHYLGFARNQWKKVGGEEPPRIKPLLYVCRVLLTGIHLMRSGVVESHLPTLLEEYPVDGVADWMRRKSEGEEQATLERSEADSFARTYERLLERLAEEGRRTNLRDAPETRDELSDFLVELRLD